MKILHVLSDTNIGGAGKYVLSLIDWANNQDEWRGSLEIILPVGSSLINDFKKRQINVTEISYINDSSFNPKAVPILYKMFYEKKPTLVHTHATLSARVAAKLYKKCVIVNTRHSVFDLKKKETRFYRKKITGWLNGFLSDAIIAVSPAALQNLISIGVNTSIISIIYNGCQPIPKQTNEQKQNFKSVYKIEKNKFIISIIARLTPVKGHDIVLDAAKIISSQDKDIVFLIVGNGALEFHLHQRVREEKITNIIFTGFLHDTSAIENITDLIINASYGTEATSIALLECMSLGIPAVVSDFGGNPYVIKNGINGLVVPKKNSNALAEAILKLKRDKQIYVSMCEQANSIFYNRFTLDIMGKETFSLYKKLCNKS